MMNPMARYARPQSGNPMSRYSKPKPGPATPERRYANPPRPQTDRLPTGRGFMGSFRDAVVPGVESLGRSIGVAATTAARLYPSARAVEALGARGALQAPASSRGKFLKRVYADQQMPAGDMPIVRSTIGARSPLARAHGGLTFDRAMKEFQRTHKWARQPKNKTDVEFAVNYLLSKKHPRYYNP
jgi:hypothetical protein